MNVKLISTTKPVNELENFGPEGTIVYCARVSNPSNQGNQETAPRLVGYLIRNKHWSPFEMVGMCVEISTTRAIAQQILRHRSFSFQEFSQRYALATDFELPELRRKHDKGNRQGSGDIIIDEFLYEDMAKTVDRCFDTYKYLIERGVAPESARFVLPLCTATRLYMNGTVRSWIHYLEQRCDPHAQKEHRDIALAIKDIFVQQFPITSTALGWKE